MVWATGQLVPEREGTLVQVDVAPPTTSTISFIAFSALFLALWLSPDVGALARATGLSPARLLFDLLAIAIVALIVGQMYRREVSDAVALSALLGRLLTDPAEPSSGSPAASRNVPAGDARPVRNVLKRLGQGFGLLWIVGFVAFLIWDYTTNDPPAARMQLVLQGEFDTIVPLPGATIAQSNANHKPGQAIVGASYLTTDTYPQIRAYYDAELTARGWRFHSEKPITDWGRNLGGKTAEYCKDDVEADLQYAGERANYGWAYALDIVWGHLVDTCR